MGSRNDSRAAGAAGEIKALGAHSTRGEDARGDPVGGALGGEFGDANLGKVAHVDDDDGRGLRDRVQQVLLGAGAPGASVGRELKLDVGLCGALHADQELGSGRVVQSEAIGAAHVLVGMQGEVHHDGRMLLANLGEGPAIGEEGQRGVEGKPKAGGNLRKRERIGRGLCRSALGEGA